jgi:hypothetical protein
MEILPQNAFLLNASKIRKKTITLNETQDCAENKLTEA